MKLLVPWTLVGATLAGCGPETSASDTSAASSGAVDATTGTPTTSSTTTGAIDTDTCGDACTDGFEAGGWMDTAADQGSGKIECDVFAQDCDDGLKCAAWDKFGGTIWNSTRCVPVTGDGQPGDPCTSEGDHTGVDDCAKGAMCWDDTCVQQCAGSKAMPGCSDPQKACNGLYDDVLYLCLDACDPLVQDCPGDDLCVPVHQSYVCTVDASGDMGATFDPCAYTIACDPGHVCLSPSSAIECDQDATGCCLPMCSIADGGAACPGVGQMCRPIYDPQPPGFEDVGQCSRVP